jgi:hypothetical protein
VLSLIVVRKKMASHFQATWNVPRRDFFDWIKKTRSKQKKTRNKNNGGCGQQAPTQLHK